MHRKGHFCFLEVPSPITKISFSLFWKYLLCPSLILSRSSFDTSKIWERRYLVFNKCSWFSFLIPSSSSFDTNTKKESLTDYSIKLSPTKKAATYSPALHCSTIGASGLNFSVRNGKRWNTTAITAWYTFIISITYLQAKCMIK